MYSKGSFTYYVISQGGTGGFQMLTVGYGGGGGGGVVWSLIMFLPILEKNLIMNRVA